MIDDFSFENNALVRRMTRLESSENANLRIVANLDGNGIIQDTKGPFPNERSSMIVCSSMFRSSFAVHIEPEWRHRRLRVFCTGERERLRLRGGHDEDLSPL
jgi:hypothetical protein